MNYLITTASSIQLTNAEGTTKTISKNQLWYRINKETITFLVLADAEPEGDGTCFFTSRISDLNVNGEVYDKDTIVKALDDIFEPVDIADVYTKRQIDEMLEEYAQVDDLNDFIMVDELPDYLADYQKKLVSGTNIKTVNGQSLLGEGNIVIEGGGGGSSITIDSALSSTSENPVQNKVVKGALDAKADKTEIPDMAGYPTTNQMNTAINSAVAGKADANSVPTKTSQLTNDSGFLTSHQSLDGLFNTVEYDSSAKRINFKDKTNTVVGYVDASDFVKDGMVEDVRIENGRLVIDFNTDAGITDISIPLTDIFNADNYYTKSEVDNGFVKKADVPPLSDYYTKTEVNAELAKKADTDSLATVATSGSYNDLSDKPIIPEGAVIDSALSDSSNNAVANRIVKGALDLKADKTEIPDMTEYYTSKEVDGMIEDFVTQKEVDDLTADFASINDVEDAVNGAKPYVYEIGDTTEKAFNDAVTAINAGQGIILTDVTKNPGYPATYVYDDLQNTIRFVYLEEKNGNAVVYDVTKTPSRGTKSAGPVTWTEENIDRSELYYYGLEDSDINDFNDAYSAIESGKVLVIEGDDGLCPAASVIDGNGTAINLSYVGTSGVTYAYQVTKQSSRAPLDTVTWTDVTPKPASITVDTEITENSQNPVTSAAIYQMVGQIEQALAQINGTAS